MLHLQIHPPKWFYGLFLSIITVAAVAITIEARPSEHMTLASRVETTLDAVVRIEGTQYIEVRPGQTEKRTAVGTGFFIGDNLILTNNHVVEGDIDPFLTIRNSTKKYAIDIVATDKLSDIALVKIKDEILPDFLKDNKPTLLKLETSDNLVPGEIVYSIGHPWGFGWSVSQGIISGIDRRFPDESSPAYYIQTDAKIFQGNSGGPLINEKGKVIGMNSQIFVNTGGSFGFALPGELIQKVITDLKEKKRVMWPVLGIMVEADKDGNVSITGITPKRPAEGVGLKVGDVILSIQSPISPLGMRMRFPTDVINLLVILKEKDQITLEIKRNDIIKMIPVVLDAKSSSDFKN